MDIPGTPRSTPTPTQRLAAAGSILAGLAAFAMAALALAGVLRIRGDGDPAPVAIVAAGIGIVLVLRGARRWRAAAPDAP